MRHFVIGTAGHIDHGKSALVKALTGTDPDRLDEEQRRGMTIDLGFAHFDLPSGRRVGIVDVPGHERLIKNMLAGASGIDLVLLVVAADEGIMPQTREHLDILRFLPVKQGIVVLNKIDLVTDPDWLDLVREDIDTLTAETFLQDAPVLSVSARTGEGIPELVSALDGLLDDVSSRAVDAPARLPIDRAFIMAGFGTVVTGTLWSGHIRRGSELELLPPGRRVRVRGLQSHGMDYEEAAAGSRVAANVVGAETSEVERGNVLAEPGAFKPTALIDAQITLLAAAPPLAHLARIRVYVGSDEVFGRVALLDRPRLKGGEDAVGQIRLERPTVVAAGDPFVLRLYSPMVTIGGGVVINPYPPSRRRTGASATAIRQAAASDLRVRVAEVVREAGVRGTTVEEIATRVGTSTVKVKSIVATETLSGGLVSLRGRFFHRETADRLGQEILHEIDAYQQAHPWRAGIPREELKAHVFRAGDDRMYAAVLDELTGRGAVVLESMLLRRPDHRPRWTDTETTTRAALATALAAGGASPPGPDELQKIPGDSEAFARAFQSLRDDGTVIEAAPGVYFHRDAVADVQRAVAEYATTHGPITVATLRDMLRTSRKFALTLLEYFDTIKFTRRVGDSRVVLPGSPTRGGPGD